ncbi:MAG: mechanosensitive ion channel [Cyclobacteriaceae bacterium]|nr:mechanosensitive ion channel [Cyclobacteriaceae bacterium]
MKPSSFNVINKIEHTNLKSKILFGLKLCIIFFIIFLQNQYPDGFILQYIPPHYVNALVFYLSGNVLITFIRLTLVYVYLNSRKELLIKSDNFILGMSRIAVILNFVVFIFALFIFFNIDYKEFFTSLSIIAAAIAILSKDYISNLINGMIIMFTDHISLGDYVKIDDYRGKIIDITFINVQLVNEDDDLVFIPNNVILSKDVVNYTKRAVNRANIEFEIKYTFIDEIGELEDYLIEVVNPFDEYIQEGSHYLRTVALKNDNLVLNFQYVMKVNNREAEKRIRRKVLRSVVKYIKKQRLKD